jgi:hypothetical protein
MDASMTFAVKNGDKTQFLSKMSLKENGHFDYQQKTIAYNSAALDIKVLEDLAQVTFYRRIYV